ncbi:MAG: transketolase [Calditrichaeota bacterium]|nr:MAG: transketolase [Calditrichota bacterium]
MQGRQTLDELCINTIRTLSIDAVQKANSGHPGLPMGAAAMAYVLWDRFLRHAPHDPQWPDRDRFVLSAGHGSMLLYSLLHLTGYDLPLEELKNFRQWGSKTPGHPEYGLTPGVETTTGPLGQGFGNGVGMAIAEAHLAARFNRPGHEIVNHFTYAIVSDGDLMEGVASEAASLAGHLKLGKLIYLYDDNHISIDGKTDLAFTEDRMKRFEAYGWHTQIVEDGNDLEAIERAIVAAQQETTRPSIVAVRTHIGFGSPHKQDTSSAHGEPLGPEEVKLTKQNYGWPEDKEFFIPEEALAHFRRAVEQGQKWQAEWQEKFSRYEEAFPQLAREFKRIMKGDLPADWAADLPQFPADEKGMATRAAGGKVINALAQRVPELVGGSADLTPSTKTYITSSGDFQAEQYANRNFHFGVREHGMGAIVNGMALHGGLRPFGSTFLVFSDYMRPSIRLAALMELPAIFVFTHDSVGLGEDGPTHQPVEHYAALRAIPHLLFIRPCDANETAEAWKVALQHQKGPVAFALSRQALPTIDRQRFAPATGLAKGAYVLFDADKTPDLILMASGSEVWPTLQAALRLQSQGVSARVVSMPCWELFDQQPVAYRQEVLPRDIPLRLAVEAGVSLGWHKYLGDAGEIICVDNRFGASAPANRIMQELGFTAENIAEKALALLKRAKL